MDKIARQGCTVVVPFREEMAKRHLKVTGDLGRVIFMVRRGIICERDPVDWFIIGI
jgi:hypothetical protein